MSKPIFLLKAYLKEKVPFFPIEKCLISDNYDQLGVTACLIIRKQSDGNFSFANILIDRLCLGVKDAIANCNFTHDEIDVLIKRLDQNGPSKEVSSSYFHNLVYGAIDYATELGFSAPKNFFMAEYLLDQDLVDDGIDEIEMGWKGRPYYIEGAVDNTEKIVRILNSSVGKDGYVFIANQDKVT